MRTLLDLPRLGDDADAPFPDTRLALASPRGLLAWGGDLDAGRLLRAYRLGIFPWYSEGQPILWWSPEPRCVIFPDGIHLSRRTRRRYNSGVFRLTADTAFDSVIAACAEPRRGDTGTWITRDMERAFARLHRDGYAHSLEVWRDGELCGGIYGIALGAVFFGESMFSRAADASKVALIALCRQLRRWGFELLDCQVGNPHLFRMGARELSRQRFERRLRIAMQAPDLPGSWAGRVEFETRW